MAATDLLPKLKAELVRKRPALEGAFTDQELVGMIEEGCEWCQPNCSNADHVAWAVQIAQQVADEQELEKRTVE